MRWILVGSAVIVFWSLCANPVAACDCAGTSVPCQAYGDASAAFVGTVINSHVITLKRDGYDESRRVVRFSVDSPFRGVESAEVEVMTGLGDADCGFGFVNAQQYLVYANKAGAPLNPQGLPVNNAEIFISEASKPRHQGHWDAAYSKEDGKYFFQRLPAGRYILQVRFDGMTSQQRPFPLVYYPGVSKSSQATVITIGEGQHRDKYDLTVPPLPLEYDVEGTVVWANGTPASNARVQYMGGDPIVYSTSVKEQGRFSFKAYEGLSLGVSASIEIEKRKTLRSNTVDLVVGPGLQSLKLIIPNP
ncbi:MAG: carboxypeptidase-like regulatory domain-containing protein [Pyrinomonadaceae bacterium]